MSAPIVRLQEMQKPIGVCVVAEGLTTKEQLSVFAGSEQEPEIECNVERHVGGRGRNCNRKHQNQRHHTDP